MGERHHQQQLLLHHRPLTRRPRPAAHSRAGGLKGVGEIVEVQGGHIVRSTGRKDRHSKVCTAKGPRDRRVRLAAHTAIQFYDVQDRLGYDRPSKAVDWLIKNAKAAIDELAELPPWHPTAAINTSPCSAPPPPPDNEDRDSDNKVLHIDEFASSSAYDFGFLPPQLDSDVIVDTIKSFFPTAGGASAPPATSNTVDLQSYPADLLSRTSSHAQDLRLSLQSFQDPQILLHHQSQPSNTTTGQPMFSSSTSPLSFDPLPGTWSEQNSAMVQWSAAERGGFMFDVSAHTALGQSPFLTQREPLQSSNPSSTVRPWTNSVAATDHEQHAVVSCSTTGYSSAGFSEFFIPARIQVEEEHGIFNKSSSASRHQ